MKIAMMIASLSRGGSERVMVNLAEYLHRQGHEVTIVTQYRLENEYEISEGITRVLSEITQAEMGGRITNFTARVRKLRNIWKELRPDVILSFIGKNNLMTIMTTRGLKVSVAVAVRGEPSEEYYSRGLMKAANLLFPKADGVILQTNASRGYFDRAAVKKSVIMKNPLNNDFLRDEYTGRRRNEIVMVGRIDENKNHKMAINAFANVADKYADYHMTIYGEGELRKALQELVKELHMEDRIALPGATGQVAEAIFDAKLFLLTSNSEGVPNTVIEAMALGIPVICTDCPSKGPAELIIDGENGILIPVGNQGALENAIDSVLSDDEKQKKISHNAYQTAKQFAGDIVNHEWEDYLSSLIKK